MWQAGFDVRRHHCEVHTAAWVHSVSSVHISLLCPDKSVHVEPERRDEGGAPVKGVASVMGARRRSRRGAGGVGAG